MPSTTIRTLIYSAFAAILCITAVSLPALAESDGAQKADAGQTAATPDQLLAEGRKIATQLNNIEQEALKNNADLRAKGKHLAEHMSKVLKSMGYFPEADRLELVSLKKSIESGKLSNEERQAKIQEFRGVKARMIKGRQEAMQDKDLQKETQEFSLAVMQAMQKQDPHTKDMLQRLAVIRMQLRKLASQQQAQH
jgi:hypothetical protein